MQNAGPKCKRQLLMRMSFVRREREEKTGDVWKLGGPIDLGLCGLISQYGLCERTAVRWISEGEISSRHDGTASSLQMPR